MGVTDCDVLVEKCIAEVSMWALKRVGACVSRMTELGRILQVLLCSKRARECARCVCIGSGHDAVQASIATLIGTGVLAVWGDSLPVYTIAEALELPVDPLVLYRFMQTVLPMKRCKTAIAKPHDFLFRIVSALDLQEEVSCSMLRYARTLLDTGWRYGILQGQEPSVCAAAAIKIALRMKSSCELTIGALLSTLPNASPSVLARREHDLMALLVHLSHQLPGIEASVFSSIEHWADVCLRQVIDSIDLLADLDGKDLLEVSKLTDVLICKRSRRTPLIREAARRLSSLYEAEGSSAQCFDLSTIGISSEDFSPTVPFNRRVDEEILVFMDLLQNDIPPIHLLMGCYDAINPTSEGQRSRKRPLGEIHCSETTSSSDIEVGSRMGADPTLSQQCHY